MPEPAVPPEPVISPWFVVAPVAALAWVPTVGSLDEVTGPDRGWGWLCVGFLVALPWVFFTWVPHIWTGSVWLRVTWLSVPALGIGLMALAAIDDDLVFRVRLAEPTLVREVEAHTADNDRLLPLDYRGRRVGSFWVTRSSRYNGVVYLFTGASGLFCDSGLAHVPPGAVVPDSVHLHHLTGNWHRFEHYD